MRWRSRKDREAIDAELAARTPDAPDVYALQDAIARAEGQTALADSATACLQEIAANTPPNQPAFRLAASWLDAHNRLPGDNP